MFRFVQLALLLSAASAFTVIQPVPLRQPTACKVIMSDAEVATIMEKANGCMGEECSVDEVEELLVLLKDTQKTLESRIENVMNMVGELQHLNGKEERQTDEVKSFVSDMLRVFAHDKPKYTPTGFSGDIGDGPQTAFDALPPKKWKPSA